MSGFSARASFVSGSADLSDSYFEAYVDGHVIAVCGLTGAGKSNAEPFWQQAYVNTLRWVRVAFVLDDDAGFTLARAADVLGNPKALSALVARAAAAAGGRPDPDGRAAGLDLARWHREDFLGLDTPLQQALVDRISGVARGPVTVQVRAGCRGAVGLGPATDRIFLSRRLGPWMAYDLWSVSHGFGRLCGRAIDVFRRHHVVPEGWIPPGPVVPASSSSRSGAKEPGFGVSMARAEKGLREIRAALRDIRRVREHRDGQSSSQPEPEALADRLAGFGDALVDEGLSVVEDELLRDSPSAPGCISPALAQRALKIAEGRFPG